MSESHHKLTKFFLCVSIFAILISVLAVYSATMSSKYNLKKNDLQVESITHLTKSQDWWNDYQSHKLREKIYQIQVDNLNTTLHQQIPQLTKQDQNMYNLTLSKYQSYLDKLYSSKSVNDSLANLQDNAIKEQNIYEQSLLAFSQSSKNIELYDLATILFILAAGLAGIAEIAKNKLLAYGGFGVGGIGLLVLLILLLNFF